MLLKLRHALVLLLFVLLPFHAFFVTLGTKIIAGAGHAPIGGLAMWKEGVIMVIVVVGIVELLKSITYYVLRITYIQAFLRSLDVITWIIIGLLILSGLVHLTTNYSLLTTHYIFGFKYTLLPLLIFLLFRHLTWDDGFLEKRVFPILLAVGAIVSAYGILTFFLPIEFFTALGYSDAHSLYSPGSSLSAFQQISDTGIRRIQSTFAGPNQFGTWLLVPWSMMVVSLLRGEWKVESGKWKISHFQLSTFNFQFVFHVLIFILIALAIFLTFSRSAWIAAFIITLVAVGMTLGGALRMHVIAGLLCVAILALTAAWSLAPNLIERSISNRHHFERLRDGIVTIAQYPLGLGLGSAGPASNRTSDACLYFDPGSDVSWAKDRRDLCLFVGSAQVQPSVSEKVCQCPRLPENWYVQVGIELGVVGLVLFAILIVSLISRLFHYSIIPLFDASVVLPIAIAFLGISIAAFFLHAWEDSAVAYTVWGLIGIALSQRESVV